MTRKRLIKSQGAVRQAGVWRSGYRFPSHTVPVGTSGGSASHQQLHSEKLINPFVLNTQFGYFMTWSLSSIVSTVRWFN